MIDPALSHILAAMAARGFKMPEPFDPLAMRAALDTPIPGEPVPVAQVRNVLVPGAEGPIPARLYHPHPGETRPLALMMHGGGWVMGTLDTHDGLARRLAHESGTAVLSIAYRLAPEYPYPAALEDCLAVIEALPGLAADFGVQTDGYKLVGDSAGGNLAAAVALALKGQRNAPLHQVLFYPVLDRNFETASYRATPKDAFLTTSVMQSFWTAYVGSADPEPLAAPLRATDLGGVAPATIILAGNDPLHDEGIAYAAALRDAGIETSLFDFARAIHGFASFAGLAPIADQAVSLAATALR